MYTRGLGFLVRCATISRQLGQGRQRSGGSPLFMINHRSSWNVFVNTLLCTGEASVLCCTTLMLMLARETRTIVMPAQLVSIGTKLDTRTNSLTMLIRNCDNSMDLAHLYFSNSYLSQQASATVIQMYQRGNSLILH